MTLSKLQSEYIQGKTPKGLNGFHKGSVELLIPGNIIEYLGSLLLNIWVPWKGKEFDACYCQGMNVLPGLLFIGTKIVFGSKPIIKKENGKLFAFPFKTKITKGLEDDIEVLQLDYNLAENPAIVRHITDELVQIDKDTYLGKAFIKQKKDYRLVAFFKLVK